LALVAIIQLKPILMSAPPAIRHDSVSANGGDLGFLKRGQMAKPFEKNAFALNEGEISDIVETQFGYHIIKLIEKQVGEVAPFKDVKDRLQEWMKSQKMSGKVEKWTDSLRTNATIEIL